MGLGEAVGRVSVGCCDAIRCIAAAMIRPNSGKTALTPLWLAYIVRPDYSFSHGLVRDIGAWKGCDSLATACSVTPESDQAWSDLGHDATTAYHRLDNRVAGGL
jgi:hypothetical protein